MPELLSVTGDVVFVLTAPETESEVGESVTAAWPPIPVSATVRGLPAELSVIVIVPVRVPGAVGVNVT